MEESRRKKNQGGRSEDRKEGEGESEKVRNTDGGKNEGVGRKVKRAMRKGMRADIYEHHN